MKILLIDDEPGFETLIKGLLHQSSHRIAYFPDGATALALGAKKLSTFDVALVDKEMPQMDGLEVGIAIKQQHPRIVSVMITGHESTETLVKAFRDSKFDDYLSKPFTGRQLEDVLLRAQNLLAERQALSQTDQLNQALRAQSVERPKIMVGESEVFQTLRQYVQKVAPLDVNVLIRGETGTGKEVMAREIYKSSKRFNGPFVTVNCAAIPSELFESELFGHVKGAFTGAVSNKEGLFKLADGGTLFLDEIGDTPLNLQAKLLRVLQDHKIVPVGSHKPFQVNVRVISATNQDLEQKVQMRLFREDLFYRLNVFSLTMPPLREIPEEIPVLAQHFITKNAHLNPKVQSITPAALEFLQKWPWKGNIRELENIMERAVALALHETLSVEDFPDLHVAEQIPPSPQSSRSNLLSNPWTSFLVNAEIRPQSEQLWECFESEAHQLWHIVNANEVKLMLQDLLHNAQYLKRGHYGRLVVQQTADLPVNFRYLNPHSGQMEHTTIVFRFLSETVTAAEKAKRVQTSTGWPIRPVLKGLPDTYIFDILYPAHRRNDLMSLPGPHIIRALVLRYAQTHAAGVPLKKIFGRLMDLLFTPEVLPLVKGLNFDGLEGVRSCLCSKVHIFSGMSSKLKANPRLVEEEIRKVFPEYRNPRSDIFGSYQ